MSPSDLQTTLRDLSKTVAMLVTKINEQAVAIKAQTKKIDDQKQLIEKNFVIISEQKRVIANLVIKVDKLAAVADGTKKGTAAPSSATTSPSATETAAGSGEAGPVTRARRAAQRIESKGLITSCVQVPKRLNTADAPKDKSTDDLNNNQSPIVSEWQTVSKKTSSNNLQTKIVQRGGNSVMSSILAVEKKKFLHIWSLHPDTTSEAITEHVETVCGSKDIKVEKIIPRTKRDYASFKVGVPESLYGKINCCDCWPVNAKFNEWVWFRNQQRSTGKESNQK
ncbi:hypothetical protein RR46_00145 [Papilio xuthus]|uniref:Uncharacterized protein n=1 Tax=Papilio xuthus TaxID=66420 RepID=A0A0N1IN61_PAPXU|nr:hypothetical protein RR46_00145 [Papilio xuthus]